VFGPSENRHFTTGPVVEFLVEDAGQPSRSFRGGVHIVSGPVYCGGDDIAWVHFRAPDGNIQLGILRAEIFRRKSVCSCPPELRRRS